MMRRWIAIGLSVPLLVGCGASSGEPAPAPGRTVTVELDDRPFQLHVPAGYDPAQPAPLVLLLHGYQSSAAQAEAYFQLTAESDRRGFLYAMPDGTTDEDSKQFWSADETCCDFYGAGVDDVAYLRGVIDTVTSTYRVDPARVYLVGHSNGGFMAHRLACDYPDGIAAIVSLAGVTAADARCAPPHPVNVLQIHGTDDEVIDFSGGLLIERPYSSVDRTLTMWRELNGCPDQPDTSAPPLDLDSGTPGPESTVTTYAGCRGGTRVELWTIQDGRHVPPLTAAFTPAVVDFLYAQVLAG